MKASTAVDRGHHVARARAHGVVERVAVRRAPAQVVEVDHRAVPVVVEGVADRPGAAHLAEDVLRVAGGERDREGVDGALDALRLAQVVAAGGLVLAALGSLARRDLAAPPAFLDHELPEVEPRHLRRVERR
jgi:hypothetical protein